MVASTTAAVSVAKFRKKINFNVQVFAWGSNNTHSEKELHY